MFLGAGLQAKEGKEASKPCPHPEATKVTRRCCLARMPGKEAGHLSLLSPSRPTRVMLPSLPLLRLQHRRPSWTAQRCPGANLLMGRVKAQGFLDPQPPGAPTG